MGVILCEFESRPPHSKNQEEISKEVSSFSLYTAVGAGFLLYSESDILVVSRSAFSVFGDFLAR